MLKLNKDETTIVSYETKISYSDVADFLEIHLDNQIILNNTSRIFARKFQKDYLC